MFLLVAFLRGVCAVIVAICFKGAAHCQALSFQAYNPFRALDGFCAYNIVKLIVFVCFYELN